MKKWVVLFLVGFLLGCNAEKKEIKEMNVELETGYYQPLCKWEALQEEVDTYRITLQKVEGDKVEGIATTETQYQPMGLGDQFFYYAQENNYYGPMRFKVEALQKEKVIAQGVSDSFAVTDYYPQEEEISVPWDLLTSFSYSGSGSSMEHLFDYSIRKEDGKFVYSGTDYSLEESEFLTEITETQWEKLKNILKLGHYVRKHYSDPEIEMLDGSEQHMRLEWKNQTTIQQDMYEFVLEDDKVSVLREWLKENQGN